MSILSRRSIPFLRAAHEGSIQVVRAAREKIAVRNFWLDRNLLELQKIWK